MSLYKNMFKFILDDSITGKTSIKESNSLYKRFFEDVLVEAIPPASDFGFKAVPYTSPTEYIELGNEGDPNARRYVRSPTKPEIFSPVPRAGRRPTADKWYTEPDSGEAPPPSGASSGPAQAGQPQDMGNPESQPEQLPMRPSSVQTPPPSEVVPEVRPSMHPGNTFIGEVSGIGHDEIKKLKDGSIQIGYINISKEDGVPTLTDNPDTTAAINEIRNSSVWRKKYKEVLESNEPEEEATAAADLHTQNIMAANKIVDMVHELWDDKNEKLLAHVKPLGTGKISLTSMKDSMLARILVVAKHNHTVGSHMEQYTKKFNAFVEQDMTPEGINDFIKDSWEDISVLMAEEDGTPITGAISSYYEALDCIIKVGTAKSEGFLLIPFGKQIEAYDSISIYNHTSSIKGLRANSVVYVPSQVKLEEGGSSSIGKKLYSTVYQGMYCPKRKEMISGFEVLKDIQKLMSPEILKDLMKNPKSTDPAVVKKEMTDRARSANAKINELFWKHSTAVLLSLGNSDETRLTQEQIIELYKDPDKFNEVMDVVQTALSRGERNGLSFETDSTGRILRAKHYSRNQDYGKPINDEYSAITHSIWRAWFLGNELLCSIANEYTHSQGITLARYDKSRMTYVDGGLEEQEIEVLDKKTGKKKKVQGFGFVYHDQGIADYVPAEHAQTKNKPFMFMRWPRVSTIHTRSIPRFRELMRFRHRVLEIIMRIYQNHQARLLRG